MGVAIALVLGSWLAAGRAQAAVAGISVEIHRTPDAQLCPDPARLWQAVHDLFGGEIVRPAATVSEAALALRVEIAPTQSGFRATLQAQGEPELTRTIVDPDAQCRGLADALAVALALWVDPNATARPRFAPPKPLRASPPQPAPARALGWGIELGALAGAGLLGNWDLVSLGGFAGVELDYSGPGLRLRALRLVTPADGVAPGSVNFDLWAGSVGPCWRVQLGRRWAVVPYVELGIGSQSARAKDFPIQQRRSAPWRELGFGASLQAPIHSLLWLDVSLGAALRLHRERFLIDEQVVEEQPWLAPLLTLGLRFGGELTQKSTAR